MVRPDPPSLTQKRRPKAAPAPCILPSPTGRMARLCGPVPAGIPASPQRDRYNPKSETPREPFGSRGAVCCGPDWVPAPVNTPQQGASPLR